MKFFLKKIFFNTKTLIHKEQQAISNQTLNSQELLIVKVLI